MARAAKAASGRPIMDIAYGDDPLQQIDFYPPLGPPPHRLVVYLHGGGWVTGNRRGGRQLSGPMNQAGYALACVGYRLLPQTDLAGCFADVANAVGYLLRHADELQIQRRGCALMGHSAGAHMAALLATDPVYLLAAGIDQDCLGAVVALDGMFDLPSFLQQSTKPKLREVFGDDPSVWHRYSPMTHVDAMRGDPRFCLMYEDVNARFVAQARMFERALQGGGKAVVSAVAPGLKHAELILLFKEPAQPMLQFVMGNLAETA